MTRSLKLEVRQTSRRFSPTRGRYGGKLYFSLAGKDGEPRGVGKAVSDVFEHGDALVLIHEADYADAIRAATAERDKQWLAAVRPGDNGKTDDGWLWCGMCDLPLDARTPEEVRDACCCSWSVPLRSLLAAGPTTERTE